MEPKLVEEVTEEDLEEARGKYGAITFKLKDKESQKELLAVKKHLKKRKNIETYAGVARELLDFYLRNSPSYNF